jgi:hypothetical protein
MSRRARSGLGFFHPFFFCPRKELGRSFLSFPRRASHIVPLPALPLILAQYFITLISPLSSTRFLLLFSAPYHLYSLLTSYRLLAKALSKQPQSKGHASTQPSHTPHILFLCPPTLRLWQVHHHHSTYRTSGRACAVPRSTVTTAASRLLPASSPWHCQRLGATSSRKCLLTIAAGSVTRRPGPGPLLCGNILWSGDTRQDN